MSGLLKSPKGKSREAFEKTAKNVCGWKAKAKGLRRQDLKTCQDIGTSFSVEWAFVSREGMDGKGEVKEIWRGKKVHLGHFTL